MVEVNDWPDSQVCIGCKHASFSFEGVSRYLCEKDCFASSECCEKNREETTDNEREDKFQ